ncbi:MAG: PAS domain S-box protein [Candidatus Acidiferrales bacterium]|jgi:PAS domain S-box-containing protein
MMQTDGWYRGLLEAAPDAMVVVNQCGEIVLLNVQAEKQFGYRRDELIGQSIKDIIPEGFAERLIADGTRTAAEALAQQIGTGIELTGRRKDGSEFPIEILLSPLEDPEGILVMAAIRDITKRKQTEEALRQSEERRCLLENGRLHGSGKVTRDVTARKKAEEDLRDSEEMVRMAVEAAEMGTWFWNVQRDEISWSDKFGALFGLTSNAKLTYKLIIQVIHQDDRQRLDQSVQNTLNLGVPYDIEYRVVWPDSSVHWIAAKGRAYRSAQGVAEHMQGIVMDITERKTSEERLVKMMGELKRSNDDLQQFAYVASHDLQEPLRMVASYTQLLARRYKGRLDSDADEFIAYAVDGSNRMQVLIRDLLAYSRAGTNGKALREVASESALKEALANLRATIEDSGADVTYDPLPTVTTDSVQLAQVFQNLVGNAIKYRRAELPHVHVSAAKNGGDEWIFSVRDNGLGIDSQYFERIFVLFQRLHGREEFEGTGIGLAICRKILQRLGGRIWVESQPEKGSTFYFALPEGAGK